MTIIKHYFPDLTTKQEEQFAGLFDLYNEWNNKINVISRKDIDNLYERHVLHSLAIAKYLHFKPRTSFMDIGCGGGFPSIPLAILFPECQFHLIDSIQKKLKVAEAVANGVGLKNVTIKHCRGQEEKGKFDFVISRAVMPLDKLAAIVRKNIVPNSQNAIPNGLICLKGGDLTEETAKFKNKVDIVSIQNYFQEPFFETKKIVYLQM